MRRRSVLVMAGGGAIAALTGVGQAGAQAGYPGKSIRWVVPAPSGSPMDAIGRTLANGLSTRLGVPIVVENKPGAGGIIGAAEVAASKPDGYTFLVTWADPLVSSVATMKVPYVPNRDFQMVTKIGASGHVLCAAKSLKANTLPELINEGRSAAAPIAYASFGRGSFPELIMQTLSKQSGIQFQEVGYKGSPPALLDLLAGDLPLCFLSPVQAKPLLEAGKLKALAAIGDQRSRLLPQVPTFVEAGFDSFITRNMAWVGLAAPSGLPKEVLQKIASQTLLALKDPEFVRYLDGFGFEPMGNTPDQATSELHVEFTKVIAQIKELGIVPQ